MKELTGRAFSIQFGKSRRTSRGIVSSAAATGKAVMVEEHSIIGRLRGAVIEELSKKKPVLALIKFQPNILNK